MALFLTIISLALPITGDMRYETPASEGSSIGTEHFSAERAVQTARTRLANHARPRPHGHGCNTHACERRVLKKFKIKFVRPYRGWLYSVRMCESGGNYRTNTGNGFYGAYQFVLSTWRSVGGWGMPHLNPPYEQDYRAVKLRRIAGTGPWPVCG